MYRSFMCTLHVCGSENVYTTNTPYVKTEDDLVGETNSVVAETSRVRFSCQVCGHSHGAELDRVEHWLLESGGLRRTTDLEEKGLPVTRPGVWIPGNPLPFSTASRAMRRLRKALCDLG